MNSFRCLTVCEFSALKYGAISKTLSSANVNCSLYNWGLCAKYAFFLKYGKLNKFEPPSLAVPIILGVFTSMKLLDDKVFLIISSAEDLIRKIAAILGFLRSSALESKRLSIADSTLPVGSIGKG